VNNVYQNVMHVTLDTTVPNVMNQESLDQNVTAHAPMDNSNLNITAMIVISNVKHV